MEGFSSQDSMCKRNRRLSLFVPRASVIRHTKDVKVKPASTSSSCIPEQVLRSGDYHERLWKTYKSSSSCIPEQVLRSGDYHERLWKIYKSSSSCIPEQVLRSGDYHERLWQTYKAWNVEKLNYLSRSNEEMHFSDEDESELSNAFCESGINQSNDKLRSGHVNLNSKSEVHKPTIFTRRGYFESKNKVISKTELTKSLRHILSESHLQHIRRIYDEMNIGISTKELSRLIGDKNSCLNSPVENMQQNIATPVSTSDAPKQYLKRKVNHNKETYNESASDSGYSTTDNQLRQQLYVPAVRYSSTSECSVGSPSRSSSGFPCEYCQKNFSNEEVSRRHLLTHMGKRTHKCTHCARSFYDQTSYARHLKSHNGEKAHKCSKCQMAFSKKSALEVHFRTHTGERPFVCTFCDKGFSISGNLHRHMLIHTGHRPYKCGKCPRAFNNPSHLARHISSFHA